MMNYVKHIEIKNLLSFVIPCYRSEKTIRKVYEEIIATVSQRPEYNYEIVAINDCSPDNVLTVLKEIAASDPQFKVVDFAKNFGKHSAVMAGLACVHGELVVSLDDDYQCPVYELWKLVDAVVVEGYDCASAVYGEKKEASWKQMGSIVNAWLIRMLIEPPKGVRDIENFYVVRRYVCDVMLNYKNPYPYVSGLLMKATHRIKMIPMEERNRADTNSTGFTLKKSLNLFLNALTAFSVKPLRIATVIGFFFSIIGFCMTLFFVIKRLLNPEVPLGYTSMMAVQLFSTGIIMLMLGIIGEYLGRIYISINNSPQYVIRDTININDEE